MISDRFESRTRKVNTMQDASFEEVLGNFALHIKDWIEDYSYWELISIENITVSGYDGIHDGGFIVLKVDQTEMSTLKDMVQKLRSTCVAQRLGLGGFYFIEGTTVLRVFAY